RAPLRPKRAKKRRWAPLRPRPRRPIHELQGWGIFDRYNGEFSTGIDIVTREELQKRLWTSDTFVDFEHGLNTAVKELRGILGDSAAEPTYIETLPRVGYRFLAPFETVAGTASAKDLLPSVGSDSSAGTVPTTEEASQNKIGERALLHPERRRIPRWAPVAGTLAMLLILLSIGLSVGYRRWGHPETQRQAQAGRVMLAVLPFENLTGDSGQEYLSDGLTEEMIAQLGRVDPSHLGVIARTSVMRYKKSPPQLEQIGRELGVQYVLEGSLRRDGDSVRVSAQLIELKDQAHLWSRQYDREMGSLLILQGEIAHEIADEIEPILGHANVAPPATPTKVTPARSEAYDLYLRGRYHWNKRTEEDYRKAAEYFEQAIRQDPDYARAYAGLADTYALMCTWHIVGAKEYMPKARAAALKALQIDDRLAEAHTPLALVAEAYEYDWQTAEREFQRAIELDPGYATAHQWYAEFLAWQGRFDEALAESERARQLDPLSLIIATDHGAILYYARQYDQAVMQLRSVLGMDPNFARARGMLLDSYIQAGRFAEAQTEIEHQVEPRALAEKVYLYGRSGKPELAEQGFVKLKAKLRQSREDDTAALLIAYLGTNRKNEAIELLEEYYRARSVAVVSVKVDPFFDPLRDEPRYQDLVRRLRLDR
ncbi:MAG TPA: tetratricopeptide repeat protein, partial [Candidatus Acidoferrum sp.]|nr:tetratricopeptide repeat protein [Candidatus Acidoferrum sp.]